MKTRKKNKSILFVKKIFTVLKLAVIAAIIGLIVYGLWQYLVKSDTFSIKNIEVSGVETISRADIISAPGLETGRNIFSVNLENAKKYLKKIRQIDNIEITKNYPDTISICIAERVPVARIAARDGDGRIELIDINGVVFPGEAPDIPKIINTEDPDMLIELIKFVMKLEETDREFYNNLSTIQGTSNREIQLRAYGLDIRWGGLEGNFRGKLSDLKKVTEKMKGQKEENHIDIRFWKKNKRDVISKRGLYEK